MVSGEQREPNKLEARLVPSYIGRYIGTLSTLAVGLPGRCSGALSSEFRGSALY